MQQHDPEETPENVVHSTTEPTSPFSDTVVADPARGSSRNGAAPSPLDDYYRPPRLTIAHLLAWITLAAVCMKAVVAFELAGVIPPSSAAWGALTYKALTYLSAAFYSAGIVGAFVILRDKCRGIAGRLQPGHWLLAIISILFVLHMLISLARLLCVGSFKPSDSSSNLAIATILLFYGASEFAATAAFVWMAIRLRAGWLWRVSAAVLVIRNAVGALFYLAIVWVTSGHSPIGYDTLSLMYAVQAFTAVVAMFVLLASALVDLARRRRCDALHWLGLVLAVWLCASTLLWWFVSMVLH